MTMPPPFHPHPSLLLRSINAVGRRFVNNGLAWLRLDEKILWDRAAARTGLEDLGDASVQEAFRILIQALEAEAELSFVGRICARSDILRLLSNRLRLEADRCRHPAIAGEVIRRPLFITGLPRSGTTLLHGLMAQDPAHRAPQVWEVTYPSPPPERLSYEADPRISATGRQLRWLDLLMPGLKRAHLIEARLPQECLAISSYDFRSYLFETMYWVPSYLAWHNRQDKRPAYEFHRRFLQHLQWRCPGQRWVLKAPSHLLTLEALLQVYPDALILITHRDPLKVLPSCTSLTEVLQRAFSDRVDKMALGRQVRQRWEEGAGLAVQHRRQSGKSSLQLFDVHYLDLVRDPLGMVRRIYDHFDLELTAAATAAMQRFLAANPQNKSGMHRYTLGEFGMNPQEERRRFQFYMEFFGIEPEM